MVLGLAEDKADTGLVVGMAQQVVDRREIEIHLAGELGLEGNNLEIYYQITSQFKVIKEEVDAKFFASNCQRTAAGALD